MILDNAPVNSKDASLKDAALNLILRGMAQMKATQIDNFVSGLTQDQLDTQMKYIYRGFATPKDITNAALLSWHEKVDILLQQLSGKTEAFRSRLIGPAFHVGECNVPWAVFWLGERVVRLTRIEQRQAFYHWAHWDVGISTLDLGNSISANFLYVYGI